jgi:hypothetical protein
MKAELIAMVCHEANRAYCLAIGDDSQLPWDAAPEWQRSSAVRGVEFSLANPTALPSASHESWLKQKEEEGWKYGPVKNVEAKEHPCFVPYNGLPTDQQVKDLLFQSIVRAITSKSFVAGSPVEMEIVANKTARRDIDVQVQVVKSLPPSRERSITVTKLQEATMWLGMDLKRINDANPGAIANPYPNSKDPSNVQIEPTADKLKM